MASKLLGEIELQTNDAHAVVRLSFIEKFHDWSGYRCTLAVVSGGFSCTRPFYFDEVALSLVVPELERMASGASGKCIIKGQWEQDYIQLESNTKGHVVVTGELFENAEIAQQLKFGFRTDQTVLLPFAKDLRVLQDA